MGKETRERAFQARAKVQRHDAAAWVEEKYKAGGKDSCTGVCVRRGRGVVVWAMNGLLKT